MSPQDHDPVSRRGRKLQHAIPAGENGAPDSQTSNRSAGSRIPYDVGSSGSRNWSDRAPEPQPLPKLTPLASEQRKYLRSRGLRRATIGRYKLGADGPAIAFPVFERGTLVNVVLHRPWYHVRYEAGRGRAACLYPSPPAQSGAILVAGMFDVLVARQHGLAAISTTCGAALPWDLAARFTGKRVALLYDAGEDRQADIALRTLDAVGAEAWRVALPLPHGGDVADWFAKYGRTRRELYALIRAARLV